MNYNILPMKRFLKVFVLMLALSGISVAEDTAKRGRLPDGRAYRVDAAGNELVDYIAELEVTNDALKQRIIGLEDEVKEKVEAIDRIKETGEINPQVEERNLLAVGNQEISGSESKAVEHNQELEKENSQLKTELAESKSKIVELQAELISLKKSVQQDASSKSAALENKYLEPKASLRRSYAFSVDLEPLRKDLLEVERLIQQRDRALDAYLDTGKPVGVAPQTPVSSRGLNPQTIKARLKAKLSAKEANKIRQDLLEIRSLMKDDIALLKRLRNL
ncbi:MAG: hypothetical protein KDD56_07745 [Bdellovibrionales bacterium]|nr:hypothetical protein [Bdellovibrionales bacterium]